MTNYEMIFALTWLCLPLISSSLTGWAGAACVSERASRGTGDLPCYRLESIYHLTWQRPYGDYGRPRRLVSDAVLRPQHRVQVNAHRALNNYICRQIYSYQWLYRIHMERSHLFPHVRVFLCNVRIAKHVMI